MIPSARGAGYRRFYLYSALSIAVLAAAIACGALLTVALRGAGLGPAPTAEDVSRALSLAIAILVFALPVGGAHLVLIARGLRDPVERASDARHGYLAFWMLASFFAALLAGTIAISMRLGFAGTRTPEPDLAPFVAAVLVAGVIGAVGFLWARATPPATHRRQGAASRLAMLLAMAFAASATIGFATGAAQLARAGFRGGSFDGARPFFEAQVRSGAASLAYALVLWAVAVRWQWRWREDRERALIEVALYSAGIAFVLTGLALEGRGLAQIVVDDAGVPALTDAWPWLALGVLLGLPHFVLMSADRGRNGHPPVVVDRLSWAAPSLAGLGLTIAGLSIGWAELTEHLFFAGPRATTAEIALPLSLLLFGIATYLPAWRSFMRLAADPESAIRRFYLFSVVCLALLATVILGALALYQLITGAFGTGTANSVRDGVSLVVPACLAAAAFAWHLTLLLRDQRAARAVAEPETAPDPLLATLEAVRSRELSVADAAARIRAQGGPR
ncbi:MAG: hypothetical protein HY071_05265 [Chloroflexi bacterium]|nr:hypothetical protein [Chloroflexota bacterium]